MVHPVAYECPCCRGRMTRFAPRGREPDPAIACANGGCPRCDGLCGGRAFRARRERPRLKPDAPPSPEAGEAPLTSGTGWTTARP